MIHNPENISIGDNVWIDKFSVLIAGAVDLNKSPCKTRQNRYFQRELGELVIGNCVHIGLFNVLQAHGGLSIGNNVTTSAGVKMYSLSNFPYDEDNRQVVTFANCMVQDQSRVPYVVSPIVVDDGVWIALDALVLGGKIGRNSFVTSQSIAYHDIPENSYASGRPARRIKERFSVGSLKE
ncbi:MAG: acyltransferase [Planctomycetota bacterium]